jgi:hypothetical protein
MFGMYSFEAKNEKPCRPSSPKRSQGQGSPAFFSPKERYFAQYLDYRHVSRDFNGSLARTNPPHHIPNKQKTAPFTPTPDGSPPSRG